MRKVLATMFAVLLFAPALFARAKQGWEHVEKLKPGTPVLISLWSGETISGRVATVRPTELQLKTADPEDIGIYQLQEFGRAKIRRVVRLRRPNLPNPERWMLTGALIEGGVGLTGAIHDVTHHDNYNWFTGGLAGSALGFFGSCAVLAGVGVVELFHHHSTMVYEAKRIGKMFAN